MKKDIKHNNIELNMSKVPLFVQFLICAIILFLGFLLAMLLMFKKELLQKWNSRQRIRSPARASRIRDINFDSDQETCTDGAISSRIPGQQNTQQSLRVNLPPEIILSPSQHIINQKSDRPPSYESLFST